jgi:hypothetical protein
MCPDFRQDIALSSTLVFCDLFLTFIRFLSSLLSQNRSSLYSTTLLLSPDLFTMSITDQITDSLPALCIYFSSAQQAYPSPSREICHYSEKFSCSTVFARALPSRGVSPVLSRVREIIPLFIALSYSLRRSSVIISIAMAAGLASVPSILMARKPPVGTDCR